MLIKQLPWFALAQKNDVRGLSGSLRSRGYPVTCAQVKPFGRIGVLFLAILAVSSLADGCAKRYRPLDNDAPTESQLAGKKALPGGSAADARAVTSTLVFGNDRAGELLNEVLPPPEQLPAYVPAGFSGPLRFPEPNPADLPASGLATLVSDLPQAPRDAASPLVEPGLLPEETPLSRFLDQPLAATPPALPAAQSVRLPTPDVERVIALPLLAGPQPQRGSHDDPGSEISAAATLSAPLVDRPYPTPPTRFASDSVLHDHVDRLRDPGESPLPQSAKLPRR
jgi:hypothetical protein